MATLLVKNASLLITMDDDNREIEDGGFYAKDGIIQQIGPSHDLPQKADNIIDATGHIVMPGMVNTHHHMFQNLTRTVPNAQDAGLFSWLKTLYPIWGKLGAEDIYISAKLAMAELLLTGCTTSSDHLYIYPNDAKLDDSILAAREMGMRFHATRGSMSIGESKGGLPPDALVEDEENILTDSERVINKYHEGNDAGMVKIALSPCSPFSVSRDLMIKSAELARKHHVMLHTHLAENDEDIKYSREKFNMTPTEYASSCGWLGADVWHAHCVKLGDDDMQIFAKTNTAIAHCPCSNMRLASGIAPVKKMLAHGVTVGLGVDGSASNDSGNLLGEARTAMLLQRVQYGADALSARQALKMATRGGAKALGRDDIGVLAPHKCADFITFDGNDVALSGHWDMVAALVFSSPLKPSIVGVNGNIVIENGRMKDIDMTALIKKHGDFCKKLQYN